MQRLTLLGAALWRGCHRRSSVAEARSFGWEHNNYIALRPADQRLVA